MQYLLSFKQSRTIYIGRTHCKVGAKMAVLSNKKASLKYH